MSTPDPATTDWVPLWSLTPSQPVVNGQWIKGVGGAMVWSAINYTDVGGSVPDSALPLRIGPNGLNISITDANAVASSGWYTMPNAAANKPAATDFLLYAACYANTYQRQIAYSLYSMDTYTRFCTAGTWSAWIADVPTVGHCATYGGNQQFGASQGWMAIYPTAYPPVSGNYLIEFGGMFTKPEAYDSQIGIHNGSGIVVAVHMPRNAGTYQHVHWKQTVNFTAGQLMQFWAQYDGPSANPCTAYERYLKWTFNGPQGADPA